jgi:hypothetical protein
VVESNSGELVAAERHVARALTLAEELDDLTEMCRALGASALVVAEQGDWRPVSVASNDSLPLRWRPETSTPRRGRTTTSAW